MHMCSMYIVHIWVLHAPAAGALVYAGAGSLLVLVLVASSGPGSGGSAGASRGAD